MPNDIPSRPRGLIRQALYLTLAFAVGLAIAFATGLPQDALAEYVLSERFAGVVTIDGLRTFGSIRADRIEIAGPASTGGTLIPVVALEGLRIDYRIPWVSDRTIGVVHVGSARINLLAATGEENNFEFLTAGAAPTDRAASIDPSLLPERVDIDTVQFVAVINDGQVIADRLAVSCVFSGTDSATLELTGRGSELRLAGLLEGLEATSLSGDVTISAQIRGRAVTASVSSLLDRAGDMQLQAHATLDRSWLAPGAEFESLDAVLSSASLDGNAFNDFLSGLTGSEIQFASLIAEPTHVQISFAEDAGLPIIEGGALIQGLRIGPAEMASYEGDVTVRADVPGGVTSGGIVQLSLDDAHALTARVDGSREAGTVTVEGAAWGKDRLVSLFPLSARGLLNRLEFAKADITAEVEWNPEGVVSRGEIAPAEGGEAFASYTAEMPGEADSRFEGRLDLGSGFVAAVCTGRSLDSFDAVSTFENLDLADAIVLATGAEPPDEVDGAVTGAVNVQSRPEFEYYMYDAKASVERFAAGDARFDRVDAELQGRLTRAADRAELSHVSLTTGDGVTQANYTDVIVEMEPFTISGRLLAGFDLAHAAAWYELPDLWGEIEIDGPLGFRENTLTLPLTVRCGGAGYGDTILPYGTKVVAEINAHYDVEQDWGMVEVIKVKAGEGSWGLASGAEFTLEPFEIGRTQVEIESDFVLFAKMGFVKAIDGFGRLTADFEHRGALNLAWNLASDAAHVVFPEEIASAENLSVRASGTYSEALEGTGSVRADRITAAGGHITGVAGGAQIANSVLSIPDLRGDVFGGRFVGQIEAHILEAGLPARLAARLTEFDLARFTAEVQPPQARFTGIADGTFSVRHGVDGLTDLEVNATSTQNFTLNRDMVQNILESEAFGATFGASQIEKTLGKFLGDADQRPFDSASLQMRDEGDRLKGTAVLLSEKTALYNGLNLTIELTMDDEALLESLRMLQESEIANVHF